MNSIERFYATVERKAVDRPASWLGLPGPDTCEMLYRHFGVEDFKALKSAVGDDLYHVDLPYRSPSSNHITSALNFTKVRHSSKEGDRTLTEEGFFADYNDPEAVKEFDWPDPSKYIDPAECRRLAEEVPEGYTALGVVWSCHFQDVCAAFGMENAMVTMKLEPEMYRAVIDRITEFYLQANEIFYSATKGKLHAVHIGNDLGTQNGLFISPDAIREFVIPGTKRLVQQAKSYGLKVMHHSCGAIREIIPDLIDAGIDIIQPIQALAKGMEPDGLKRDFGSRVSFCGGVDVQKLLIFGTREETRAKVKELMRIFPTGLIVSPSHEGLLPDINPDNIEVLFETVREK